MTTETVKTLAKSPLTSFSDFMEKLKPQMALALPKHLNADRVTRLALTAFSTSPKLQLCSIQSIAASIMTAAQLGLEPGVNGAGFLVPYESKSGKICTFVPGWKGLVDLVSRSGRGTVYSGVIYSDQKYTFSDGSKRELVIHNETNLRDPSEITHAYAVGWANGAQMPIIELWRVAKIRAHRDAYNKVGNAHYSFKDWEMYARKVPLLQVLKYMPSSVEVSNAIHISHAAEAGRMATIEDGIVIDMDDTAVSKEAVKDRFKETPAPEESPKKEATTTATTHDETMQTVYALLDKLFIATGESADDIVDRMTNGKCSVQTDLENKPENYVQDIVLRLNKELGSAE